MTEPGGRFWSVLGGEAIVEVFAAVLASKPGVLRGFRHRLRTWLEVAGVSARGCDAIVLAAHEAAANGVQHATIGEPVTVRGRIEDGSVLIEVGSEGLWGARSDDRAPDERGRGLALMKSLMSSVEILTDEQRTTVRLRLLPERAPSTG